MALIQIPEGRTGLADWLAMNTTARVFHNRLQPGADCNCFVVDTIGALWKIEYVGNGMKGANKEMVNPDAARIMERAEGLYNKAVSYAKSKEHSSELRHRAVMDAKLTGFILGKSETEIKADIYGEDAVNENL